MPREPESAEELRSKCRTLEEENRLLRAAIQASPAGILIASSPDGVIRVCNPAALGIRGSAPSDLVEIPLELHPSRWQTFHPDGSLYAPEDLPMSRALLKGEVVEDAEVIIRKPDGSERWVLGNAAPVFDEDGNLIAGVVVFPDVTDRKLAEQKAERFYRMAELSSDFVGMATPDGKIFYVNPAGLALCKMPPDTPVEELHISDFHPEDEAPRMLEEIIPEAISSGSWSGETALKARDGTRVPVSQLLMAHRDATGRLTHFSTVMRDLRTLRSLEAQLSQSQRLDAVGRLAGGIAHDFNNLLTVITNYVQMVRDEQDPDGQAYEDLARALEASERATALCRQLLGFARRQVIAPHVMDLNALLDDFTQLLRRLIGEDVQLVVEQQADLWPVKLDRSQFEQVLANLAVNARDAMPDGGRLTIETRNATFSKQEAALHPEMTEGDYVGIIVSDTGLGMSEEVQSRAFDPFYSTKEKGTGLGLATVHGAVKQNSGHVWLSSSAQRGTRFEVWLPRARGRPSERTPSGPSVSKDAHGTIFVVEDEPVIRRLTQRILESAGYGVVCAASAEEALLLWPSVSTHVRLLLTDVVMPGMNGRILASKVRAEHPSLPVLFISGYAEDTLTHGGIVEDQAEFLPKPFTGAELLGRLEERLQLAERGDDRVDGPRPPMA